MPTSSSIYLDNNATTPVLPEVFEAMRPFLTERFANPSAGYRAARAVRKAVDEARAQVAALVGADTSEIVFTSGGTESNNTAIQSALRSFPERRHVITTAVEHSAVREYSQHLEKDLGYEVTWLGVDEQGLIDLEELRSVIRPGETAVVALIWANNETGVISPLAEAAAITREAGVLLHTDAVQVAGKLPLDLHAAGVQMAAFSGHKFHAPKGVGALYVKRDSRFSPMIIGGGQEGDRRSGTENVAGIVAMGKAAEILNRALREEGHAEHLKTLRDRFEGAVLSAMEEAEVNGHPERRLPNTSNLYFKGVDAEGLLILLDDAGVYASPGSACSTGAVKPSPVLTAMGMTSARARSSIRFSFSMLNTAEEADRAAEAVVKAVGKLRITLPKGGGRVVSYS